MSWLKKAFITSILLAFGCTIFLGGVARANRFAQEKTFQTSQACTSLKASKTVDHKQRNLAQRIRKACFAFILVPLHSPKISIADLAVIQPPQILLGLRLLPNFHPPHLA